MANDYTDQKYYVEPDSFELSAAEEEELLEDMYEIGVKPGEIVDPKERTRYEAFIRAKAGDK